MSTRWMTLCCMTATLGALAMAGQARAEACGDNADGCPKGFTCESYESGGACAAIDIACAPDDAACLEKQKAADAECNTEVVTYQQCEPADCTSDADCGDGMVCHESSYEECDGGGADSIACAEGQECEIQKDPSAEKPTCTTTTTKTCTPKYALPCEDAADCGEGFTCEQYESCGCSGSAGGSVGSGGGTDPGVPAPVVDAGVDAKEGALSEAVDGSVDDGCECKVDETQPKHCEAEEIACDDASDCPDTWTCESYGGDAVCSGGVARPTIASADGGEVPYDASIPDCEQPEEKKLCTPPYGDVYGRAEADSSGLGGGGTTVSQGTDKGAGAEGLDDGESASGADAGTGGEEEEKGLCSVTRVGSTSDASGAALLLGLVGLALAARRRNRR
jgi:MYXO-CTERM domain-containing protein